MSNVTQLLLFFFVLSTWNRLERLEDAANLIPGRWRR